LYGHEADSLVGGVGSREALAVSPGNALAYIGLGRVYDATGRTADADAAYALPAAAGEIAPDASAALALGAHRLAPEAQRLIGISSNWKAPPAGRKYWTPRYAKLVSGGSSLMVFWAKAPACEDEQRSEAKHSRR
jgi:hypothetical protein